MMDTLLLLALNGLIWGLIIALIALGLSIIFGLLDIINLAHGDFFMVGTVLAWFTLELTGNFWAAFLVVPLIGFILGALIQHVVIQLRVNGDTRAARGQAGHLDHSNRDAR